MMIKRNEANERLKREYFAYLREAEGYGEQSVDAVAAAIARFETYNKHRAFKAFHHEQAIAFKRHLAAQTNQRTHKPLSKSTIRSTLKGLRSFFRWLAGRPGFRSRFTYDDADYFNPTERDVRIALAQRPRPVPTVEQVMHTISLMPDASTVDRRDRALIAFILLTGCRDRALVSLKVRHVDLIEGSVFLDGRDVETKFGKTFTTYFFRVDDAALRIVTEWIYELRQMHLWGPDDPLFPATQMRQRADNLFAAAGIERRHWKNTDPVRRIFKTAFARAGLQYFNPHSIRATLGLLGQEWCPTLREYKAWSQNLGHESLTTTLASYGRIDPRSQGEIIKTLGKPDVEEPDIEDLLHKLAASQRRKRGQRP